MRQVYLMLLFTISCPVLCQDIIFTQQKANNDNLVCLKDGEFITITNHLRKDSSPMISPDGKQLVFTSERIGWWKIWKMDLATKELKQLTFNGSAAYSPNWSPNSKRIVYTSQENGNQEIFTMNEDGSEKQNITNSQNSETMPFWANDGFIYYSSQEKGIYQIARCKPDGSNKTVITETSGDKLMPQLSSDQKEILYYGNEDGNMEIYLYNIASKSSIRLTNHSLMDIRPRWSADNTKIVFERGNKKDNQHIFIMNRDGSQQKQLTFEHYNYAPSFIPSSATW